MSVAQQLKVAVLGAADRFKRRPSHTMSVGSAADAADCSTL